MYWGLSDPASALASPCSATIHWFSDSSPRTSRMRSQIRKSGTPGTQAVAPSLACEILCHHGTASADLEERGPSWLHEHWPQKADGTPEELAKSLNRIRLLRPSRLQLACTRRSARWHGTAVPIGLVPLACLRNGRYEKGETPAMSILAFLAKSDGCDVGPRGRCPLVVPKEVGHQTPP